MALREPGKVKKLPETSSERKEWHRRLQRLYQIHPGFIKWAINITTSLFIVLIVLYPRQTQSPKRFEDEGIAIRTVRVLRDMDVEDRTSTEAKKKEAADSALAVYDLDTKAWANTQERLKKFFQEFREVYPTPEERTARETESIYVPPDFRQERSDQILKELNISLTQEQIETLKKANFPSELENAILSALQPLLTQQITISKELLLKEKARGVIARKLPGDERVVMKELDSIMDIEGARSKLRSSLNEIMTRPLERYMTVAVALGEQMVAPTLTFNKDETEKELAKTVAQVKPVFFKLKRGEIIVREGDRVTEAQRIKIKAISEVQPATSSSLLLVGLFIIIALALATVFNFAARNIRKFTFQSRDLVFLSAVMVGSLLALKGLEYLTTPMRDTLSGISGIPEDVEFHYLIVLAGSIMLVRLVMNSEVALVFALLISLLGGLVAEQSLPYVFYSLVGGVVGASEVGQCQQRSRILRAGLIVGVVNFVIIFALSLVEIQIFDAKVLLYNGLFGFLGGIFGAIIITGVVPIVETIFGYATDIKLLELLNQDNRLLKDLVIRAPGTHQHSMVVASLAEAATESVLANPLLSRVMAMYHDIGKVEKPAYFAENQWDHQNPHMKLKPTMSALIITNHVREGIEMAERQRLPRSVIEGIQQHHGTTIIKYFYDKAKEAEDPQMETINPEEFRYDGPKPQTRETGILMLADIIESAARTIREPNQARLQGMVQKQINRVFTDGQLDECELTLKDLNAIARAFNKVLAAMYHSRPDYSEPVEKGAEAAKKTDADTDKRKIKEKNDKAQDSEEGEEHLKRLGI